MIENCKKGLKRKCRLLDNYRPKSEGKSKICPCTYELRHGGRQVSGGNNGHRLK
jgi:hypothetical protein